MSDRERDPKAGINPKEKRQPVVGSDVPDEERRSTTPKLLSKSVIKTTAKRAKNPLNALHNEGMPAQVSDFAISPGAPRRRTANQLRRQQDGTPKVSFTPAMPIASRWRSGRERAGVARHFALLPAARRRRRN